MRTPALDHVGVVTRDLATLAAQYERLGFTLTPFARQSDGRIGNRCVMLRRCYIELLAVTEPNARSATLERFLARYTGIHILAFAMADETAERARLQRAGIDAPAAVQFERAIDDTDPTGSHARFTLIQLPDQPEGRINLVRHLTPEALWQASFLRHRNNAVLLDEVEVAVAEPMEAAARLSRLVGCPVVPDPVDGLVLDLPQGRVRLVTGSNSAALPYVTGVSVRTSDENAAIGQLLTQQRIQHSRTDTAIVVEPDAAGGVALRFTISGRAI